MGGWVGADDWIRLGRRGRGRRGSDAGPSDSVSSPHPFFLRAVRIRLLPDPFPRRRGRRADATVVADQVRVSVPSHKPRLELEAVARSNHPVVAMALSWHALLPVSAQPEMMMRHS